jgi:hypothetical protein
MTSGMHGQDRPFQVLETSLDQRFGGASRQSTGAIRTRDGHGLRRACAVKNDKSDRFFFGMSASK